jgi:hypothetical protein
MITIAIIIIALGKILNRTNANIIDINYGFIIIYVFVRCLQNGHFIDIGLIYYILYTVSQMYIVQED